MSCHRFYRRSSRPVTGDHELPASLGAEYDGRLWRPSYRQVLPRGFPAKPFLVWWLFDRLRVFSSRGYAVYVIRRGEKVVHRSCVFPRYFRFPFMERQDLQIGDTWTAQGHRGLGLATYALKSILALCGVSGRSFWYVVEEDNAPSVRVVEKVGFDLVGVGNRHKRLGLNLLGTYDMVSQESPNLVSDRH